MKIEEIKLDQNASIIRQNITEYKCKSSTIRYL